MKFIATGEIFEHTPLSSFTHNFLGEQRYVNDSIAETGRMYIEIFPWVATPPPSSLALWQSSAGISLVVICRDTPPNCLRVAFSVYEPRPRIQRVRFHTLLRCELVLARLQGKWFPPP